MNFQIIINADKVLCIIFVMIDVLLYKGCVLVGFLLCYYLFRLIIATIKRKKFKNALIGFMGIILAIIIMSFIGSVWNEEMKKNTIEYYNSSKITKGTEEKEIAAFNLSRTARIYFENDEKFVSIYLFNFTKFIYDGKGNWEEIERD